MVAKVNAMLSHSYPDVNPYKAQGLPSLELHVICVLYFDCSFASNNVSDAAQNKTDKSTN